MMGRENLSLKYVRVGDRSLVSRIVVLCLGMSLLLAIGVTTIGYTTASRGLSEQGAARLASDAHVVASTLDHWNIERLEATHVLAGLKAMARALDQGDAHSAEDAATVNDAISGVQRGISDIQAITIIDATGLAVYATSPVSLGANLKNRDYFQAAMQGHDFITGVSISLTDGAHSIFRATPVRTDDGRIVGVVQLRSNPASIQEMLDLERARVGDQQKGVLLDESGLVVASSVDPDWLLRPVTALQPDVLAAMARDKRWGNALTPDPLGENDLAVAVGITRQTAFTWRTQGVEYHAVALPLSATHWTYVAALPAVTFDAAAIDLLRTSTLAVVLGLLLATVATVLLTRPVARALRGLTRTASALAEGDAEHDVVVDARDEVGQVALAFRRIQDYQRALADVAASMADGDLTREVFPASDRDALGVAFEEMQGRLGLLVREVQTAAVDLASSAECVGAVANQTSQAVQQVSSAVQSLALGAQETNASAARTTRAIAELAEAADTVAYGAGQQAEQVHSATATVRSIVKRVEDVGATASAVAASTDRTLDAAHQGAAAVGATTLAMAEIRGVVSHAAAAIQSLGALGEKIGAVVETIDDVAEQTNLLALNAAIEAARAGEHGRGFAVVADEVRKLAERASRETKQISQLIRAVQDGTRDAVSAMEAGATKVDLGSAKVEQAGATLRGIVEAVEGTAQQVATIAHAADELADGARQLTGAMQAIQAVVDANASATRQMVSRAEQASAAISDIANVSAEQNGVTEEVSASTEEMAAQAEEMSAQAGSLAMTADTLRMLVSRFRLRSAREPVDLTLPRAA
jgi:methyl-accepting chemotaxis protein